MSRPKYESLNVYGDMLLPTVGGSGVDISSQRMDDLDKAALAFVKAQSQKNPDFHVIDLGGGSGRHALRMAQMGAKVTMVDVNDVSQAFEDAVTANIVPEGRLRMVAKDFADLDVERDLDSFDMIYSQRALSYLPYPIFAPLMKSLIEKLAAGGKVFLSVNGYDNEYGKTFPLRNEPLETRFGKLTEEMQEKHAIYNPVIIYKLEEIEALCETLGLEIESLNTSTFGNVKVIARKPT